MRLGAHLDGRGARAHPSPTAARRTPPEMCAREKSFNRGATGRCADGAAQIWKSREEKCLTVSKNRRHNGKVRDTARQIRRERFPAGRAGRGRADARPVRKNSHSETADFVNE